jgi:hypothetical protein
MPAQEITTTAVCEVGIRHDKCKAVVRSLTGDRPCSCPCHALLVERAT